MPVLYSGGYGCESRTGYVLCCLMFVSTSKHIMIQDHTINGSHFLSCPYYVIIHINAIIYNTACCHISHMRLRKSYLKEWVTIKYCALLSRYENSDVYKNGARCCFVNSVNLYSSRTRLQSWLFWFSLSLVFLSLSSWTQQFLHVRYDHLLSNPYLSSFLTIFLSSLSLYHICSSSSIVIRLRIK
jgi:hypothetical protein